MEVLSYFSTLHAEEVAAQEKISCWQEGGLTEVYTGNVHFYQNAGTSENRMLGQVVLFPFRALCSSNRSYVIRMHIDKNE